MMNLNSEQGQHPVMPEAVELARQSSIYGLTFNEFQNSMGTIGKDFGSMNMDEFLKNIWTSEESNPMAVALGGGDGGSGNGNGSAGLATDVTGLQRQVSLTLPRTLSQKTVDEVWRDLVSAGQGQVVFGGAPDTSRQQWQPTLGEMTLEEFLVRAGIVTEKLAPAATPLNPVSNSCNGVASGNVFYSQLASPSNAAKLSLGFNQPVQGDASVVIGGITQSSAANLETTATGVSPYVTTMPIINGVDIGNPQEMRGRIVNIGDAGMNNGLIPGVISLGGSPANPLSSGEIGKDAGDLSSVSPAPYVFNVGLRGRKSGTVEKLMERRQRRMIKNRESAARSRARKQAYAMELEVEVAMLKEQNQDLQKKQIEMMEKQKNQILEMLNQPHCSKKVCLRRTQTGPW